MEHFQSSVSPAMIHIKVLNIVDTFCELRKDACHETDYENWSRIYILCNRFSRTPSSIP